MRPVSSAETTNKQYARLRLRSALTVVRHWLMTTTLTIVGNKPRASVQELGCDHVTVTGYVPDVEPPGVKYDRHMPGR